MKIENLSYFKEYNENGDVMELMEIFDNIKETRKLMHPYRSAIEVVTTKLHNIDDELKCENGYSPIHNIQSRIKTPQSIIDKLPEKEKDLLKHIETSLGVEEDFKFGYGHSANLISLLRTPNNSLPIFWLDKGRSHSAPFPR